MNKIEALYSFFSSFGIPAYEENSVYAMADDGNAPSFPYLTCELKLDSFGESDTFINFSLWYRTMTFNDIQAKSDEIAAAIGRVGKMIDFDNGSILIMRTQPWAQSMSDGSDDLVKRFVHTLKLRYYSNN